MIKFLKEENSQLLLLALALLAVALIA